MANVSFLLNQFPAGGVERVTMNLIAPLTYEKGHNIFIFVHMFICPTRSNILLIKKKKLPLTIVAFQIP